MRSTCLWRALELILLCACCLGWLPIGCSVDSNESSPPTLVLTPSSVAKEVEDRINPPSTAIEVTNGGDGELHYAATEDAFWITLSFPGATTAPSEFFINLSVGQLEPGFYVDTVWVTSPEAVNSPQAIEVALTVEHVVLVSPPSMVFGAVAGGDNPAAQSFEIAGRSDVPFEFYLSTDGAWIGLSTQSGISPDTVEISVDISNFEAGVYVESVFVEVPFAANPRTPLICTLTVSSWFPQQNPEQRKLQAVYFTDAQTGWAVGSIEDPTDPAGYIINTTDGGRNWAIQFFNVPSRLADIQMLEAQTGYIVGAEGLALKTTNGGSSWLPRATPVTEDLSGLYFADVNTGWAVGRNGTIIHTADAGDSWQPQTSGVSYDLSAVEFVGLDSGWVVGNGGTILFTADGGTTWSPQIGLSVSDLRDIHFIDNTTGWVVGELEVGVMFYTTTSGLIWSPIAVPDTSQLNAIVFVPGGGGWAAGQNGTILHSENGQEWMRQPSGTTEWLFDLFFIDGNIGWAVGDEGVILQTLSGGI